MKGTRLPAAMRIQPPLIPVIDVVFDLLIFFLLIPSVSQSDGFLTTNLPDTSGWSAGLSCGIPPHIKIALYDEGLRGEGIAIVLNESMELGANFAGLRDGLIELRGRGLASDMPILIAPTMACRHKWVVDAFDAAVAARFTKIQFAVPYE